MSQTTALGFPTIDAMHVLVAWDDAKKELHVSVPFALFAKIIERQGTEPGSCYTLLQLTAHYRILLAHIALAKGPPLLPP